MQRVTIFPAAEKDPTKQRKSRSFSATSVAFVCADGLWEAGNTENKLRPVWWMVAGSDGEIRPFVANIRKGRPAELEKDGYSRSAPMRFEVMRSAGYEFVTQRTTTGASTCTIYQPDLVALNPGMIDPAGVQFLCLTPGWWAAEQAQRIRTNYTTLAALVPMAKAMQQSVEDLIGLAPLAVRWTAYLESRTRRPIPTGVPFACYMYTAALEREFAVLSTKEDTSRYRRRNSSAIALTALGLDDAGMLPAVATLAAHGDVDAFLANTVQRYYEEGGAGCRELNQSPLAGIIQHPHISLAA